MATEIDLQKQISQLFLEKLNLEVPSSDTDLLATGVMDSLHFAELLVHFEHEFGIIISLDDIELDNFRTIQSMANLIAGLRATPPAEAATRTT